jgi:hypothetical protein
VTPKYSARPAKRVCDSPISTLHVITVIITHVLTVVCLQWSLQMEDAGYSDGDCYSPCGRLAGGSHVTACIQTGIPGGNGTQQCHDRAWRQTVRRWCQIGQGCGANGLLPVFLQVKLRLAICMLLLITQQAS